jgi:hypothetical protein
MLMHCWLPCAALRRKGKGDDVAEEQMDAVVRAHNGEPAAAKHSSNQSPEARGS